jgi:hypothetical protein
MGELDQQFHNAFLMMLLLLNSFLAAIERRRIISSQREGANQAPEYGRLDLHQPDEKPAINILERFQLCDGHVLVDFVDGGIRRA